VIRITALLGLILIVLAGCSEAPVQERSTLRAGVLPDRTAARLYAEYEPLFNYLSEKTGKSIELVIPEDYQDLLRLFDEGEIDLGFFGGLTFLQAQERSGAIPLVTRDIDTRFTSLFISREDAQNTKITDFKNKKLGFGSQLSTSGHLMPRYFLRTLGIEPETFFSNVIYTGAHDKTAMAVLDGTVDIGVANTLVIRQLLQTKRLGDDKIRILWETPPYTDYVWAVQAEISPNTKNKLQEAFLALSIVDETQRAILTSLGAQGYLPVRQEDFIKLRQLAIELDLL